MKRFGILFLILALVLAGCGEQEPLTAFDRYGNEYTIDREQGTIFDGENTYQYTYEGDSEVFTITIDYPNGGCYRYSQSNGFGSGSWNAKYSENFYKAGDLLADMLQDNIPKKGSARNIFVGILLMGLGTFYMVCPHAGWYLSYGWRFKDAEPSDAALIFGRISGAVVLVIGIFTMLC